MPEHPERDGLSAADATLVLAHASDLHILGRWSLAPWRYLPKRWLGAASYGIRRAPQHPARVLRALVRALAEAADVDHVALTGDLVNLSFEGEFEAARRELEPLLARGAAFTSAIPGNHDRYTYRSARERRFESWFSELATSDVPAAGATFPFVRVRKGVAILGLDSAVATPPGFASGRIGREQLAALDAALARPEVAGARFRVVLVHHAPLGPHGGPEGYFHGLHDERALLEACGRGRVGLVLHGHVHVPFAHEVERGGHRFAVVGVGSSTRLHRSAELVAGFNVYVIEGEKLASLSARTFREESGAFDGTREVVLRPGV